MRIGWMVALATVGMVWSVGASAQNDPAPKPKPIGGVATWIPPNSYPPAAQASMEEGRVTFMLDVDESGRAVDCKVTVSSDSPLLDETTCNLMMANARFEPARDKKNRPTASTWSSSVRWKIEKAPEAPAAPAAPAASAGILGPTPAVPVATKPVPAKPVAPAAPKPRSKKR